MLIFKEYFMRHAHQLRGKLKKMLLLVFKLQETQKLFKFAHISAHFNFD